MRIYYLFAGLSFFVFCNAHAQINKPAQSAEDYFNELGKEYWHGIYTQGIEVGGGIGDRTQFFQAFGSWYLGESTYLKFGGKYEFANINNIDYNAIYGDVSANFRFLKIGNVLHLHATGGGSVVYDQLQDRLQLELDHDFTDFNGLNFGVFAGGEAVLFLGRRVALVGFANQRFYFLKEGFGQERYFAGVGIKYAFKQY